MSDNKRRKKSDSTDSSGSDGKSKRLNKPNPIAVEMSKKTKKVKREEDRRRSEDRERKNKKRSSEKISRKKVFKSSSPGDQIKKVDSKKGSPQNDRRGPKKTKDSSESSSEDKKHGIELKKSKRAKGSNEKTAKDYPHKRSKSMIQETVQKPLDVSSDDDSSTSSESVSPPANKKFDRRKKSDESNSDELNSKKTAVKPVKKNSGSPRDQISTVNYYGLQIYTKYCPEPFYSLTDILTNKYFENKTKTKLSEIMSGPLPSWIQEGVNWNTDGKKHWANWDVIIYITFVHLTGSGPEMLRDIITHKSAPSSHDKKATTDPTTHKTKKVHNLVVIKRKEEDDKRGNSGSAAGSLENSRKSIDISNDENTEGKENKKPAEEDEHKLKLKVNNKQELMNKQNSKKFPKDKKDKKVLKTDKKDANKNVKNKEAKDKFQKQKKDSEDTIQDSTNRQSINDKSSEESSSEVLKRQIVQLSRRETITEKYIFGEEVGSGGYAVVYKGKNKESGEIVAIKVISTKRKNKSDILKIQREIENMKKMVHKNIVALEDVFYDELDSNIYMVMEFVSGGELFDEIVRREVYSEQDAAHVIRQILEAVEYMHKNGIAHRDLKPENLLCTGPNNLTIKVSDFGLSKEFEPGMVSMVGTPDYVAPELLRRSAYNNSVDIWSIGVITYILLCGSPPFYGETNSEMFKKILACDWQFYPPDWDEISTEAKEFVSRILVPDPDDRPTATQCLESPWIVSKAEKMVQYSPHRRESLMHAMTDYTDKRKKTGRK